MGEAIGQSLPIAVGVLVSPMPIVALVLMLVSQRAASNGTGFVAGWLVGIFVLGSGVALLADGAGSGGEDPPVWAAVLKIVLGALLLLLAVRSWRGRPGAGETAPVPKWMAALDEFNVFKAFGTGVLLGAVNPKNLLLVVSAGTTIATATSETGQQLGAMAVFTFIASLGVLVPFGIYLVTGERAATLLEGIKAWMIANNAVIMTILLVVLGVKMVGDGMGSF
ncbi:GAP family protein [Nocardioides albus]|uniref:Threonine/homoserine/homoserine lactone efflux protein n=1 Tax=Nocardioides albus TaxID=1841 RepID=A0A7W5A7G2_9ACTN|nr:GAP family protein [Nocardioides albus]MBB3091096.1 threonine/homoserine/homoserine lactone efflux protein [Nocardioides albus]GGU34369.1 membrane protein [Nocardioides albus]